MGASCAGCGACCEVIGILATPEDLKHTFFDILRGQDVQHASGKMDDTMTVLYERAFMAAHWHPIEPDAARQINARITGQAIADGRSLYTCDQYDAESRRCLAHDRRPAVCRNFPWYGKAPNNGAISVYPRCSFWHDVPREEWPIGIDPLPSPQPENCC